MAEAANTPSLKKLALGDVKRELDVTRSVVERLPDLRLEWRPHDRSWTAGELGAHVVNLLNWMEMTLEGDGYDMAGPGPRQEAPASTEELLDRFDSARKRAEAALEAVSEEALLAPWTLRRGDDVIFTLPRLAAFRTFAVSHMVHHRGQLSIYLRLLDVAIPPIYGPTADESG